MKTLYNICMFIIVGYFCFYIGFNLFAPKYTAKYLGIKGYTILSNSMSPTINKGDIAFVKYTDYDNIKVNDIVAAQYKKDIEIVHYVAEKHDDYFKTKRENAKKIDYWSIDKKNYIGKYWFKIPYAGYVYLFIVSTIGKIVIILNIVFYFIYYIFSRVRWNSVFKK